ncbi:Protein HIR [Abortiporus biennis]
MKFTKPAWVGHNESSTRDQSKLLSMFSCDVHPDGSRIATGGLDAKIRIWSTKPILNHASELSGRPPKSLCTLAMHTGPVLTLRWAHSGRWLASGSDDQIVMVWDLDPMARGKVFGSDEVNVEGWKPLKRLVGHESDVTDVAWSTGDRYLASVGLDSKVMIWCGFTLERLRVLEQHQGFVKGVCWDPVGQYLATTSDDRTVKIWRTTDWKLEAEIKKPFEDSPGTFFRRLSWSPDGAHITASNATNNKGYVFIAAVISRNTWTSEISLVGHENAVEVAAYNPHIFLRDPSQAVMAANICSVVALGSDDRSISIWQTKSARPIVVAKEVFERQIMDLSWSMDGLTLYAVSSDGTMAVFSFDPAELEGIAPLSVQEKYLTKFGFTPPPLPAGYSHQPEAHTDVRMTTPPPSPGRGKTATPAAVSHEASGFGLVNGNGGEHINKLVAKRKTDKKRIQPTFAGSLVSNIPSSSTTNHNVPTSSSLSSRPATNGRSFHEITGISSSRPPQRPPSPTTSAQPSVSSSTIGNELELAYPDDEDVAIESIDTRSRVNKGKRKANTVDFLVDSDRGATKPRTLGGDRLRESVPVREIAPGVVRPAGDVDVVMVDSGGPGSGVAGRLPSLSLLTYLKASVEGSEDYIEGRNAEDGVSPPEIIFVSGKQTQWLDYLPSPILALTTTNKFSAVAMQDGTINVYSPTGRRLMPSMSLGAPCSSLSSSGSALMLLTSAGLLYAWDVKKQEAFFSPVPVAPILGTSPNCTVISATIRPNGSPLIQLSNGIAHSYNHSLLAWTKVSESWWATGSDSWPGRQRSNSQGSRALLNSIECSISEQHAPTPAEDEKPRPTWWSAAMTLGHLETKLHAAKVLDSPAEYKFTLILYAKRIADEGFRAKAEELVKELFGPMYWRPGRDDSSWSPTLLGFSKRDLLKEVLVIFARSKTLTKLAIDWQDIMKKASSDD